MPEAEPILLTTRGQWVSNDWVAVTRGVRRHADAHDRFLAELLAWQAVLPEGSAFTHLTAARLHHWWLPPMPDGLPVFVAVPAQARIRRAGLVAIRRSTIQPWQRHGVWVDDPVRALLACARDLEELDLTCLVDAALHAGHLSIADLRAGLPAHTRGARRLSAACKVAHPLSESIFDLDASAARGVRGRRSTPARGPRRARSVPRPR